MARLLVSASNHYYSNTTTLLAGFPFTLIGRTRLTSKPTADQQLLGLYLQGGGSDKGHYVQFSNSGSQNTLSAVSTTSNNWAESNTGSVPAAGTWFNWAGLFHSATSREAWLNGTLATGNADNRAFEGNYDQYVGAYAAASGVFPTLNADIADFAILNVAPTAAQLAAFNKGFSPRAIWPAHQIVEAWDFFGHVTDEVGHKGIVLTANGTPAKSAHGGSYYYPFPPQTLPSVAGTAPAAAITGTAGDGAHITEIVAGGETIIITLTNDTWVTAGATFNAQRQNIIDGLDSAGAEATGWNNEVRDNQGVAGVVRTSDTVVTITLDAQAAYNITAPETITVTVPGSAVVGGNPIVATPTFEVSNILDFSIVGSIDLELELSSPVGLSIVGTLDLEIEFAELPLPPVLDFEFTGSIDLEIEIDAGLKVFDAIEPGISHVTLHRPNGTVAGTVTPLRYRLSRFENQVGAWECDIPVDEEITDGVPLASEITYGWRISITQENFNPNNSPDLGYLLYQGIVEDRSFRISQGGTTFLAMTGSFRTYEIVRRSVLSNLEYDGNLLSLSNTLVGSLAGGPIYYNPTRLANTTLKGSFTDLSRYAAWTKAAQLGRHVIRESWEQDRPEIVPYDGSPQSGITFRPLNPDENRYLHENGGSGVALIAGTPTVKYDGSNVVNRIIAKGVDTIEDPEDPESLISAVLTLQWASLASPYTVKAGANPDATLYYYIEDQDSIDAYGLTEVTLTFSDVKNPNDDTESRRRAANVLYMRAVNEMIKRRSEKIEVTLPPLANGARIWALPGDQTVFEYHGEVLTADGTAVWMDIDRRMLITQRHEESHPSGIRRVGYLLAAPEMEFPVPGLPDEISLPPLDDGGGGPDDPGTPDAPGSEPCCDDPNDDENEGPDDEFEENFPEPEVLFARLGAYQVGAISTNFAAIWHFQIDGNIDLGVPPSTTLVTLPGLGAGTFSVTARVSIGHDAFDPNPTTYRVALMGDSTELGGSTATLESGEINFVEVEGGFPQIPVIGSSFAAGTYSTVWVRIYRVAGAGIINSYNPTLDSYIRVMFTPA